MKTFFDHAETESKQGLGNIINKQQNKLVKINKQLVTS